MIALSLACVALLLGLAAWLTRAGKPTCPAAAAVAARDNKQ